MDILVFVKRVPDTESKIRIDKRSNSIIEGGAELHPRPL